MFEIIGFFFDFGCFEVPFLEQYVSGTATWFPCLSFFQCIFTCFIDPRFLLSVPLGSRFPGRHGQVPKGNETQGHFIVLLAGERRENQGHDDMLCVSVFSLFEVKQCHQEELPKSDEEIRVTAAGSVSVRFREGEQIGTGDMQLCGRLAFGQDWPLVV